MPISIIVEDGSNVADANSFNSLSEARTYASNRGIELPSDDDELAAMLITSTDYLESKACDYQGKPTNTDQSLAWPRTGVYINCNEFPNDAIPKQLKSAQCQLIFAINAGIDIFPNVTASDYVIEEKVGPITTKYSDPAKLGLGDLSPTMTAVEALLKPLFEGGCSSSGFSLTTVRA